MTSLHAHTSEAWPLSPRSARRRSGLSNRCAHIALVVATTGSVVAGSVPASAQQLGGQFPFPSTNVQAGVTSSAITSHELRSLYLDWRDSVIVACPQQGDLRVQYPETNNDTRSEGIGYGMVIAAYMGDEATFDGLWSYYQRTSSNGLMNWLRNGCDSNGGDNGSAADADIDAALALIVADKQFPNNGYGQDATRILGDIRGQLFQDGCAGVLLAGNQFAQCNCINPSYIPPGYYVAYGDLEQPGFWDQARDASYNYFNAARNNQTGLVPAWSQSNGNLQLGCNPQVAGGGQTSEYQADAARTPWRVATDYQWTGDSRAQDFLDSLGNFAKSQSLMRIADRYSLDGQPANADPLNRIELGRNTYVMGGFATAMVSSSQQDIDDFAGAWISVYKSGDNFGGTFRAFNNSLALLYGLVVTGTMWSPFGPNPSSLPEAPLVDATPGNLLVNGDFDEGMLGWEARSDYYSYPDGPFTNSNGFARHDNGQMRLRVIDNEPEAPFRLSLRQAVSIQAGQRYLLSVDARAEETRPLRLEVQGAEGTYASLVGEPGAESFTVDPQLRTYQLVFEAGQTDPEARVAFLFGDSGQDVLVDNVILAPTDLPLTPGGVTPGAPAPSDSPSPQSPAPSSPTPNGGNAPPGNTLGPIDLPNDSSSPINAAVDTPQLQPAAVAPQQSAPAPFNAATPNATNCAPAAYSPEIDRCYNPEDGFVWDERLGLWTYPPVVAFCGTSATNPNGFYWWPAIGACYDPATGYAWDALTQTQRFVGANFILESETNEDSGGWGCSSVGRKPGSGGWASLLLLGLMATGWSRRKARFGNQARPLGNG